MSTEPHDLSTSPDHLPPTGGAGVDAEVEPAPQHRLPPALRAMRPRQWTKNVLVFTAPLAGGLLLEPVVLGKAALAFVAFCLVSAAVYLVNDIHDVAEDRLHPRKRHRPIAAGQLGVPAAWVLAAVCALVGFGIAFLTSLPLGATVVTYLVLQVLYSLFLKHMPIIDLAMVASGFLLRAVAGGVASGIELSQWFLLVASFGSLFMVAGKRYSEFVALGVDAGTRKSLERYSESYLRFSWMLAASMVVVFYSLWAFEQGGDGAWGINWAAMSIAPFTLGMLQYALKVDTGEAGEPEDIVLQDRVLQVLGVLWVVLISLAVFG
ncbi:decaprenyl-phosphate phosphoribosyltransferase [Auraticoccus monumenti]|uniref:Decaprenyl-phosphate phosphoribosyltransferase n=1 Tax=Auraticoccus monumenti TaxID=675864 RepID=A0A1G6XZL5_9ACTN|nr:decaprenyl-phosphate phosphoribosyltransferase [Auraticoccus monumenti]SDD83482.1 decaprenyl-phosphate phosphoribosyltransferase [Auraticoccus monumenti]